MSQDIREMPIAVVLWKQNGCPACDAFLPKFRQVSRKYENCIPIIVADVGEHPKAADHFRITTTPTVIISRFGMRSLRFLSGDAAEWDIESLLMTATRGRDCEIA